MYKLQQTFAIWFYDICCVSYSVVALILNYRRPEKAEKTLAVTKFCLSFLNWVISRNNDPVSLNHIKMWLTSFNFFHLICENFQ